MKKEVMKMLDKNGLSEEEYLKRYDDSKYPKPSLTADNVILSDTHEILLVKRGNHPFLGKWALPGGFANKNEPLEETAARELFEETGLEGVKEELVGVYSKPNRDPRGWVVTQAYLCKVNFTECKALAGDDAKNAEWFDLTVKNQIITLDNGDCIISFKYENGKIEYISKDKLAFDHAEIIAKAIKLL